MKFGFIPVEGGRFYPDFLEETVVGESLGFDSVWLEEHHGVRDHYWPSPMMGLAGAATRTDRILLGTDILVLPFYHPVRAAEDAAMLDIMSQGRFILGTAIGYKPDEFELYQVPMEMRGARFNEAICLMKQLWTQDEVHFNGTYYQVDGLHLEPKPLTRPHPPLWLGGWGERSLARAASIGDAWIPGPTANLDKLLQAQRVYNQHLEEVGLDPRTKPTPLTREVVIADTDEEALEVAEKHLMVNYRDEYGGGKWNHPLIGGEDATPIHQLETLRRDRFLVGSPDTVIEQIQRFKDLFGVDHLICRLYFPGLSHAFILRELHLLAREVMPAFRHEN